MKEKYWRYSLVVLIIALGIILFKQAQPFLTGILGGFALFVMLRNPTYWLQKKMKPALANWIVTVGITLFILVPLCLFGWVIVQQITELHIDPKSIIEPSQKVISFIKERTGYDLLSENTLGFVATQASSIGQSIMSNVSSMLINLFVAIMILYFMLQGGRKMEAYFSSLLPFTPQNKKDVLSKVQIIVRSNTIGIPLLAIIQGIISLGGYLLCGAPNPLLAAVLTAFASIIPIVGTVIIWLPICIYFLIIGDWVHALILFCYGTIIVAQSDNLIRFILQKKMADIHPLITIFGVVAGVPLFGFMGVIFGPLLVSLFLLFVDMFRKEYLVDKNDNVL